MHVLIVVSLILLFWCEFTLQYFPEDEWKLKIYALCAFFFNTVHGIELVCFIAAFGFRYVVTKKRILVIEMLLQIGSIFADYYFFQT